MISYSSAGILSLVRSLNANTRDLTEPTNDKFYQVDFSAQRDINARYDDVLRFRSDNGMEAPQPGVFSNDTSVSGGFQFFKNVVTGNGIEETFSEDLVYESTTFSVNPRLMPFIDKMARKYQTVISPKLTVNQEPTAHLLASQPPVVADEDSVIFNRLKNVHQYVRQFTR